MKTAMPKHSSYAALFDPVVARAAAARAAQWNLPRHVCRPLDCYAGKRVTADLAAFDAAVELAPIPEEELAEGAPHNCGGVADMPAHDPDFADDEDL